MTLFSQIKQSLKKHEDPLYITGFVCIVIGYWIYSYTKSTQPKLKKNDDESLYISNILYSYHSLHSKTQHMRDVWNRTLTDMLNGGIIERSVYAPYTYKNIYINRFGSLLEDVQDANEDGWEEDVSSGEDAESKRENSKKELLNRVRELSDMDKTALNDIIDRIFQNTMMMFAPASSLGNTDLSMFHFFMESAPQLDSDMLCMSVELLKDMYIHREMVMKGNSSIIHTLSYSEKRNAYYLDEHAQRTLLNRRIHKNDSTEKVLFTLDEFFTHRLYLLLWSGITNGMEYPLTDHIFRMEDLCRFIKGFLVRSSVSDSVDSQI